jgi:YidC/Oxa1 family membrane protein insertase
MNLVHHPGNIPAFGINLADKALGDHHTFVTALPYIFLILVAIGLQYFQMRQLNKRNSQAQANPQMQMMQRYMPLIFAVIYINIAAGVNIYFIVSSLCRIGIQEAIFRSGALDKARAGPVVEGSLPSRGGNTAAPRRRSMMERLADMQKQALEQKAAQQQARQALPPGDGDGKPRAGTSPGTAPKQGPSSNGGPKSSRKTPPAQNGAGPPKSNGQNPTSAKNTNGNDTNGSADKKTTHPRSKTKRERKDR